MCAGWLEKADAQARTPRETDEIDRALDSAAHDPCLGNGLRDSPKAAACRQFPTARPGALKEDADARAAA
jgi:hypothetical protein